jgi:cytochrome-b5 reductase
VLLGIKNIAMIAGGSGITPMLQIARYVFKHDKNQTNVTLLFANKSENDILLRDEIEQMKKENPERFRFTFTVDSPPEGWNHQTGPINEDMLRDCLPTPNRETVTLICGPPPMVKFACLPNLQKLGHEEDRIFVY